MAKIHIYRPLGDEPPETKRGELELGRVHTIDEAKAQPYLKKRFVILSNEEAAAVRAGKPLPAARPPALPEEPQEQSAPRQKRWTDGGK